MLLSHPGILVHNGSSNGVSAYAHVSTQYSLRHLNLNPVQKLPFCRYFHNVLMDKVHKLFGPLCDSKRWPVTVSQNINFWWTKYAYKGLFTLRNITDRQQTISRPTLYSKMYFNS
jgi:hypothetical protein